MRMALIIGAPDDDIPGVKIDIKNIRSYLSSPVGGFWYPNEIKELISPSVNEVRREIELLKKSDYSFVFFAGHGYHSSPRERTIVHLNKKETLDSLELRVGALRHTLILDCCRKPTDDRRLLKAAMESFAMDSASGQKPSGLECRKYFDKTMSDCDTGLVVMNSCSVDETAGESVNAGGYYTSSLIDSANAWAQNKLQSIDLKEYYATSSTQNCHNKAVVMVKSLSGNRQNSTFESPRAEKKFPFAVVA